MMSAHPSSSVMVWMSPVSHQEHESLSSPTAVGSTSKTFVWGKLMHLYLSAWKFGLYSFHESLDSEETDRHLTGKADGCTRQQAAGNSSCIMTFSHFWPPCPAYVLP